MAKDHSHGTRNVGKSQPLRNGGVSAPPQAGHNSKPVQAKHHLRVRHTSFGGRSTCLAYAEFDPNEETITVVFDKDGREYDYPCTLEDWRALKSAESVGQEFNFNIKV